MTRLTRRRFVLISAAAISLPGTTFSGSSATWRGQALGAAAHISISGLSEAEAGPIFERVRAEIVRLELIFSLYRAESCLSRLNATGTVKAPPPELLEVLSLASTLHHATGGAFDPSVQPIWKAYYASAPLGPDAGAIRRAQSLAGWDRLTFGPQAVRLAEPGMALTLNGIAQGYITDRIAALLRREGLGNVLIDIGEVAALGKRPDGGAWKVGITEPGGNGPLKRIRLSDRALATSAPLGTRLWADGPGHVIDPQIGQPAGLWDLVSVSAESAALADGLSTAFCLMGHRQIDAALEVFASARIEYLG